MSEKFSEKQKYNIDYKRSHDDKTQNQRKYIAKFIVFFYILFILQRESAKIV